MQGSANDIEALGADDASFAAERRSLELFGFPLLSRAAIVQRNPEGLPPLVQAEAVMRGIAINQGHYETELLGAIPVPNAEGAFPGAAETNTTVVTFVFADPTLNFFEQTAVVEAFAAEQLTDASDAYVGVTGSIPARAAQGLVLNSYVHIVEAATVLAVLTIVALTFGSMMAPALTLISVGAAVFVTLGVSGWAATIMDVSIPADLRPLIVALLLGIVTDYCIFYLSGLRTRLREGHDRLEAARLATASFTPIVTVAGVTVAAGTASLLVAESPLFSGFGPALALTVLTGLVVAITLVPALLAIVGRAAFWPRALVAEPAKVRERPSLLTRAVAHRGSAFVLVLLCVAGLGTAAYQARNLDLGLGFVQSLPETTSVQRAADAASQGFAPGIISPTEIVLEEPGIGEKADEVAQFGEALKAQPGVAGVMGPGDLTAADEVGAFTAESGDAVRKEALLVATPESTRAITSAGLALAASFGLLALVPLGPFRELGFLLGVGILIDVFVVRALLVPSLITLVGPVSSWPSGILKRERRTRVGKERANA